MIVASLDLRAALAALALCAAAVAQAGDIAAKPAIERSAAEWQRSAVADVKDLGWSTQSFLNMVEADLQGKARKSTSAALR